MSVDEELIAETEIFTEDIQDLLHRTISPNANLVAEAASNRVVITSRSSGGTAGIPLTVQEKHRLDLRLLYRCSWDSAGRFLAIDESNVAIAAAEIREPLIRFHYLRHSGLAPAHIHVHAERGVITAVRALGGTSLPAKLHDLHLPVGGKRFRPSLEGIIEFLVSEWHVDFQDQWQQRVDAGRRRWEDIQLAAALRDYARHHGYEKRADAEQMVAEAFADVQ